MNLHTQRESIHSSKENVARSPSSKNIVIRFGEMIRFSHTLFALPFALLATVLSIATPRPIDSGNPLLDWRRIVGILLCMVFARSSAMAFNRWIDADVDADNPRTAQRHIPSGSLTRLQVIVFWLSMSLGFILSCVLFLPNRLPLYLSLPVLLFIWGYSLTKRFTALCHVWLGAALMLAPLSAWIAMRGEIVQTDIRDLAAPLVLGLSVLCWVTGFDIIYALQDEKFDRQQGLFSIPSKLGQRLSLRIAAVLHALMILGLIVLALGFPQLSLGPLFLSTVAFIAGLLIWEHRLADPADLGKLNIAFFQINVVISFLLMLSGSIDSFWR